MMDTLFKNYPMLKNVEQEIQKAFEVIKTCYQNNGMVLVCGNGGSASDSEHIVGELMKGFLKKRALLKEHQDLLGLELANGLQGALPAISLNSQTSLMTAYVNDVDPDMVFAQQVYGYRNKNNVVWGLSTSGNSKNVVNAMKVAKAFGMATIGFTGNNGGSLAQICDVCIKAPSEQTHRAQEYHLPIYHTLCAMIEHEFFK